MKRMLKKELAQCAGVSMRTFSRWLSGEAEQLKVLGVQPKDRLLTPKAVRYICEKFDIEVQG
ncbi:MAG: DUF4248 domain-containing protein [Bacteroidaceae bacterium]|nr:DUF4248 domain-containing protein [Bacteroidaceae bacterium]